jgi:hypothetical protein
LSVERCRRGALAPRVPLEGGTAGTRELVDVLNAWANFYVIMGSSAAALTGLMFVVISLAFGNQSEPTREGIGTFNTPTIVHFCAVLLCSALLSMPWHALPHVAIALGLVGLYGIVYGVRIALKAAQLDSYEPDVADWVWHAALPIVAYVLLLGSAIGIVLSPESALFALAGSLALLIFIGIHNAWDVVTYLAIKREP